MGVEEIKAMKGKEKITLLTCYDYSFAKAISSHVDLLLVGDSLGNVVLGYDRTKHVQISDMIRHVEAVKRGAPDTIVVGDLPFGTYDTKEEALKNSRLLMKAGADAVKPEGRTDIIAALVQEGIPVMAHLGLLPQTAEDFSVVGREEKAAEELISEAKRCEEAGAFSLILEAIPTSLAQKITESINIPTIGIGAGKETDGQVLVLYDLLGLFPDFAPKFVRPYLNLKEDIGKAVKQFSKDVKSGSFPSEKESFR